MFIVDQQTLDFSPIFYTLGGIETAEYHGQIGFLYLIGV